MQSLLNTLPFGLLLITAIHLCAAAQPNAAPPESMTRIVVRLIGEGVKLGSAAALPKTIYVADPHYARIEDPPDARLGVQKLTIIAEPDAYSVNLIDRTGTHALDNGGEGDLHLPIVLPFDPKRRLGPLDKLQFGDEVEGFEKAGAAREAGPIVNSKPTEAYVLSLQQGRATLVVRSETHLPVKLTWPDGDGTHTYEYIEYQTVPFDPALFRKPQNIRYRELPAGDNAGQRD